MNRGLCPFKVLWVTLSFISAGNSSTPSVSQLSQSPSSSGHAYITSGVPTSVTPPAQTPTSYTRPNPNLDSNTDPSVEDSGSTVVSSVIVTTQTSTGKSADGVTEASATQLPGNSLTVVAFGVISFILILIIVMVCLVTAINLRGRCNNTKEEGIKSCESVVSESNTTTNGEKGSILLVSMRTLNTDTDMDSPQVSSVHSTILDSED